MATVTCLARWLTEVVYHDYLTEKFSKERINKLYKMHKQPCPGGSVGGRVIPYTTKLQVLFPVRTQS